MNRFSKLLPLLLVFLTPTALLAQAGRSPEATRAFADWLVTQEEYTRAAGEDYRFLFTAPEKEKAEVLRLIGSCYFKAREYRRAILVFERLIASWPASPLIEEAYYEAAYCSFKLAEYDAVEAQIARLAAAGPLPAPFLLLGGAARMAAGDYRTGALLLNQYLGASDAAASDTADAAQGLIALAAFADQLPTRNAWAAGIFSSLLPGAGKVYAGRWEDGLVSFLLCAFLGGMAAYSFWSEGVTSVKAWLYTGLGAVFYIGDIWGSAVAADQFNQDQRNTLSRQVKARVEIILP
jgi:tetratricopeptide (TPR) repeat protein